MDEHIKHAADAGAIVGTVGTVMGYLPSIAALFTIIWTGIRIYESRTFQRLIGRV